MTGLKKLLFPLTLPICENDTYRKVWLTHQQFQPAEYKLGGIIHHIKVIFKAINRTFFSYWLKIEMGGTAEYSQFVHKRLRNRNI